MGGRALFAYGSLEFPSVMRAVTGRSPASESGELVGYERVLLRGRPYPGVFAREGARTDGRLYLGLDEAAFSLLDRYEDACYERRRLPVLRRDGSSLRAEVYVIPDGERHRLGSEPWQRERFERDHLAAFVAHCERFRRLALRAAAAAAAGARG